MISSVRARLGLAVLCTLVVTFLLCTATPAHAAGTLSWSAGQNISNSKGTSVLPVLRATPDGQTLHMVWIEIVQPGEPWQVDYANSTDGGLTWGNQEVLTINRSQLSSTIQDIAMSIDSAGQAHVIWSERDHKRMLHIYYRRRGIDGTWTDKVMLAQTAAVKGGDAYSAAPDIGIAINPTTPNLIHVVWKGSPQPSRFARWAIYYAYSDDGGQRWQGYQNIATARSGAAKYNYVEQPVVLAEPNGDVHVLWRGASATVGLQAIHKVNGVWGLVEKIDTYAHNMAMIPSPDGSGKILVVYEGKSNGGNTRGIRFATWTATSAGANTGTWTSPQLIANETVAVYLNHPTMQADANGNLYMVYDRTTGQVGLAYRTSTDYGKTWSDPVTITANRAQYPTLRFAHGQLNLGYAARIGAPDRSGSPGYEIVFSSAIPQ